jgi:hypothetical protein
MNEPLTKANGMVFTIFGIAIFELFGPKLGLALNGITFPTIHLFSFGSRGAAIIANTLN